MTEPGELAIALVQSYCGWHIAGSVTTTLTVDGSGGRSLLLPSLYVTDVSSVSVQGTTLDPGAYDWSQAGIIELRSGCFPDRLRSVQVTITHGYPQMPVEVQAVIDQLTDSGIGAEFVQIGPFRFGDSNAGDAMLTGQSAILDRYRLPSRP